MGVAVVSTNPLNEDSVYSNELRRKSIELNFDPKKQKMNIKTDVISLEEGIPANSSFGIGKNCCAYNYLALTKGIDKVSIQLKRKKNAIPKSRKIFNKQKMYFI